eukprot:3056116-Rhodomonas_salina.4
MQSAFSWMKARAMRQRRDCEVQVLSRLMAVIDRFDTFSSDRSRCTSPPNTKLSGQLHCTRACNVTANITVMLISALTSGHPRMYPGVPGTPPGYPGMFVSLSVCIAYLNSPCGTGNQMYEPKAAYATAVQVKFRRCRWGCARGCYPGVGYAYPVPGYLKIRCWDRRSTRVAA